MTPRAGSNVAIIIACGSIAFSVGLWVGQVNCKNDIAVLKAQIEAHEKLPIHPGAATSDALQALERRREAATNDLAHRVERLERMLDELSRARMNRK